jgi:hypothetical protein
MILDAKFWVGAGDKPTPQGIKVADENGKEGPLRRYDHKTIVLTLPGDLTIFDIGHFGVWCEAFTVDFGHVTLPSVLSVPPSLKMLGVLPQVCIYCTFKLLFNLVLTFISFTVAKCLVRFKRFQLTFIRFCSPNIYLIINDLNSLVYEVIGVD